MEAVSEKCADPGKKRKSGGAGRGLGTGDGAGPLGIPVGKKRGAGRYVRGEDLAKWTEGSLEAQLDLAEAVIREKVGGPVEVIATRPDGALFRTPDGVLHEAAFTLVPCLLSGLEIQPSTIPVYEGAALPGLVAEELRALTAAMLRGEAVERTRVRALAELVQAGEPYTVGAALALGEALLAGGGPDHWHAYYEAHREPIRTALWGQIREREGRIPGVAYAKIPRGRLPECEPELWDSLRLLRAACAEIVDEVRALVFDGDEAKANGAIRDSLLAEVQTLHGLLAKVGSLVEARPIRAGELERIAEAHDRWCGRARTMEVMAAHLSGQPQKGEARS